MSDPSKIKDSPHSPRSGRSAGLETSLKLLGVDSLHDCDVLLFLFRHRCSLIGADQIARLLGYDTKAVIDAVHTLESSGLLKRSRASQGTRMYEISVPEDPPKRDAFNRLMSLAATRAGRLRIQHGLKSNSKRQRDKVQPLFGKREGVPDGQ